MLLLHSAADTHWQGPKHPRENSAATFCAYSPHLGVYRAQKDMLAAVCCPSFFANEYYDPQFLHAHMPAESLVTRSIAYHICLFHPAEFPEVGGVSGKPQDITH